MVKFHKVSSELRGTRQDLLKLKLRLEDGLLVLILFTGFEQSESLLHVHFLTDLEGFVGIVLDDAVQSSDALWFHVTNRCLRIRTILINRLVQLILEVVMYGSLTHKFIFSF